MFMEQGRRDLHALIHNHTPYTNQAGCGNSQNNEMLLGRWLMDGSAVRLFPLLNVALISNVYLLIRGYFGGNESIWFWLLEFGESYQ